MAIKSRKRTILMKKLFCICVSTKAANRNKGMNTENQIRDNRHTRNFQVQKNEKRKILRKIHGWQNQESIFYFLNEEIKCYFIIEFYFHSGQKKPFQ